MVPHVGSTVEGDPGNVKQRLLEKSECDSPSRQGTKQKQSRRGDKSIKQGLDSMRPGTKKRQKKKKKKGRDGMCGQGRSEFLSRTRN